MTSIAMVALDAMEQDAHWAVLQAIHAASDGDVSSFAASLEQFGLVELASIGIQTSHRLNFLDFLDQLIQAARTKEIDAHKAIESNLWLLGRSYATIASNKTLKNIIQSYCDRHFSGERADKRPDLLLAQNYKDDFLLIEFKRPHHSITRDDMAQAEKYRDDLSPHLHSSGAIEIMMIGQGRSPSLNPSNLTPSMSIRSYASIISSARHELTWLLESLQT